MVGVAGSGKTTALDTASTTLEQAAYRVLGTSTSGQATRTVAAEVGVEARTFQSMLWRLDHGQITLDNRTVVVVDELAWPTTPTSPARSLRSSARVHRSCSSEITGSSRRSDPGSPSTRDRRREGTADLKQFGEPEARRLQTDIDVNTRDLTDLAREDLNARTARIQARAAERSRLTRAS